MCNPEHMVEDITKFVRAARMIVRKQVKYEYNNEIMFLKNISISTGLKHLLQLLQMLLRS